MEYKMMTATGIVVSKACLGTMTFGGQVNEADAIRITHAAIDYGINFIDTANVYIDGDSERILGKALKGRRDDVILATKVRLTRHPEKLNLEGLNRRAILREVERSLSRLGTDYIDVYYLHSPDIHTPIEETVDVMNGLVHAGKIRYWGVSNFAAWQLADADHAAAASHAPHPILSENVYNLLCRGVENELTACLRAHKVGMTVYNPLAGGLLTGKYSFDHVVEGGRFDHNKQYLDRYWNKENFRAIEKLKSIAEQAGISMPRLALKWCAQHDFVDSVLIGLTSMKHLEDNLSAFDGTLLDDETLRMCDAVWCTLSGTNFQYNR